jgi:hypothetical protein
MAGERLEQTLPEALTPARKANRHVERPPGLSVPKQNGELRRRGCDRARLAGRAHSRPAADGLGLGRPVSCPVAAGIVRARALAHRAHAVPEGDQGLSVAVLTHSETATFEVRASEVANQLPGIS